MRSTTELCVGANSQGSSIDLCPTQRPDLYACSPTTCSPFSQPKGLCKLRQVRKRPDDANWCWPRDAPIRTRRCAAVFGIRAPVDFNRLGLLKKKTILGISHLIVTKGCPGMLQIEPTGQAESTEAIVLANSKASSSEIVPLGMI